ncbi:MAG TPA: DUF1800 domain-containing protein [Longimicrobiales bacterium]|nr:DUF1800 domain-containing protein [Longimicrobiales bacterium]
MVEALRALNRFGLGARPGERGRIGDPRAWLLSQLTAGPPGLATPLPTAAEISSTMIEIRRAGAGGTEEERARARQQLNQLSRQEQRAALESRLRTDRPFVERLVAFWSNHLCVSSQGNAQVTVLAGSYEREVIRPHVLGRFEDMVLASARHPAMLMYLDNYLSIGPNSPAVQRGRPAQRNRRGLNENYARELLELHTIGVDGGYTQDDVIELARALTGWTLTGAPGSPVQTAMAAAGAAGPLRQPVRPEGPIEFVFVDLLHEPGVRTLLGRSYPQPGQAQAEAMIRDLCRSPAAARFVATKLVTHFVSDDPPASAVDRIADVFESTGGDLRAVSAALVELPEAWSEDSRKFRTPQDWLIAVLRALDVPGMEDGIPALLVQLRQPLWAPPSPKGYGDTTREWSDAASLLNRAELARSLARRPRLRTDPRVLAEVIDLPASDPTHEMLADTSIPVDERMALVLAGPAFQWR